MQVVAKGSVGEELHWVAGLLGLVTGNQADKVWDHYLVLSN